MCNNNSLRCAQVQFHSIINNTYQAFTIYPSSTLKCCRFLLLLHRDNDPTSVSDSNRAMQLDKKPFDQCETVVQVKEPIHHDPRSLCCLPDWRISHTEWFCVRFHVMLMRVKAHLGLSSIEGRQILCVLALIELSTWMALCGNKKRFISEHCGFMKNTSVYREAH